MLLGTLSNKNLKDYSISCDEDLSHAKNFRDFTIFNGGYIDHKKMFGVLAKFPIKRYIFIK
jgi:hypothetical protein